METCFCLSSSPDKQKFNSLRPLRLCGNILKGISFCGHLRLISPNALAVRSAHFPWRALRLCASHLFLDSIVQKFNEKYRILYLAFLQLTQFPFNDFTVLFELGRRLGFKPKNQGGLGV